MKSFLALILIMFFGFMTEAQNLKISQLLLGSAATTNINDSFPYYDSVNAVTKRLTLYDIANIPSIVAAYATTAQLASLAPLASPTFTGTVTAPTFVGNIASSGIQGTTAGGNASAGVVGEYLSSNPSAAVTPGATTVFVPLASLSLTAGDWDVWGSVNFITGSTTGATSFLAQISLNSTSSDSNVAGARTFVSEFSFPAPGSFTAPLSPRRINLTSTTTVYVIASATYTTLGTATFDQNSIIQARRVR